MYDETWKEIPLTQGKIALVDAEDYSKVISADTKWRAQRSYNTWYAVRSIYPGGIETSQMMHVFIMGSKGIDHINGNGLDNRRENLRIASLSQNKQNEQKRKNGSSQFKGVHKHHTKWRAKITINHEIIFLGRFSEERDAAIAYDKAARKHFGEYACVNFPQEGERSALPLE